jgi:hypothetical protein
MHRYFFDIRDRDGVLIDDVGLDFENVHMAVAEARRAALDMARDALINSDYGSVEILVRDGADGPVLVTVSVAEDHET